MAPAGDAHLPRTEALDWNSKAKAQTHLIRKFLTFSFFPSRINPYFDTSRRKVSVNASGAQNFISVIESFKRDNKSQKKQSRKDEISQKNTL